MEFSIWQAPGGEGAFDFQYNPAHPWKQVWQGEIVELDPVERTLEHLFAKFQRVDDDHMPPPSYTGRSLSSGDLVKLDGTFWFCEMVGWRQVPAPAVAA